jgi:hypothetical protein
MEKSSSTTPSPDTTPTASRAADNAAASTSHGASDGDISDSYHEVSSDVHTQVRLTAAHVASSPQQSLRHQDHVCWG